MVAAALLTSAYMPYLHDCPAGQGRQSSAAQPQPASPALSPAAAEERLRALAAAGRLEGIEQLLRQHPGVLNAACRDTGTTALVAAARQGREACVAALLTAGADVGAADNDGRSALQLAVGSGHLGCVESLLEGGADPNAADSTGSTVLHLAVQNGTLGCLEMLLAAGGNPAARNGSGDTPLHCCCAGKKGEQCGRALLAAGADPNWPGGGGQTVLHRALQNHDCKDMWHDLVQVLVAAGAETNAEVVWHSLGIWYSMERVCAARMVAANVHALHSPHGAGTHALLCLACPASPSPNPFVTQTMRGGHHCTLRRSMALHSPGCMPW